MIKDIIGYEGIYQINEYGDIRRADNFKLLHPYITNKGYKAIDLHKDGVRSKFLVHRLVALHFVPNPHNYPIVLHKDNVKLNTHYTNLVWGTYSQNNAQAIKDGLNTVPINDTSRTYVVFNESREDIHVCVGAKEVIELTQTTESIVRNCLFRKTPISKGPYSGYYIGIPINKVDFDKRSTISP